MKRIERKITVKLDADRRDKYEITSQGFLMCDAYVTRAGVFDYHDADGRRVREFRPPEEVFAPESMATLKMIPVTVHHPDEPVTVENIKKYQVGTTGERVFRENDFLACKVQVTDKNAIQAILERHRQGKSVELSCGYDAEVEEVSGAHPAEGRYDAVQHNIRYNHLSIVEMGRAGTDVKLKLDKKEEKTVIKFFRKAIKLDGFQMDEIREDAPQEAGGLLNRLSAKLDEAVACITDHVQRIADLTRDRDETLARADALSDENEALKQDIAGLRDPAGETIQGIIQERIRLEKVADGLQIQTDGLDNQSIKVAVIQKVSPEFSGGERSDDYINARFDAVVEMVEAARKDGNDSRLGAFIRDAKKDEAAQKTDHRQRFIARSRELHHEKDAGSAT